MERPAVFFGELIRLWFVKRLVIDDVTLLFTVAIFALFAVALGLIGRLIVIAVFALFTVAIALGLLGLVGLLFTVAIVTLFSVTSGLI